MTNIMHAPTFPVLCRVFLCILCMISREGIWTWSYSFDEEVDPDTYSDIWTPNNLTGNADDCVVMTMNNASELIWKDIACLDVEYEGKPIQVPGFE